MPPTLSQAALVHTPCPEVQGPGAQQQQSHKHTLVQASKSHKPCVGFLVKSYQTLVRAGAVQPVPRMTPATQPPSVLVTTAVWKCRHQICHCSPSAPQKCWWSFAMATAMGMATPTAGRATWQAQPCLLAQVLTAKPGFRGIQAPPLQVPQCPWILKNRYQYSCHVSLQVYCGTGLP